MKKFLATGGLVLCCVAPAAAAGLEELTPYLTTQYFTWKERSGGKTLLKEQGPLFAAGVRVAGATASSFTIRGKGELFGGAVDYHGQTQAPQPVPVDTLVGYYGLNTEVDFGRRFQPAHVHLEPFAGIGYRGWFRDLHDSSASDGSRVSGYTEGWQVGYGRLGARAECLMDGVALSAQGGAKYPFYVGNTVDFAGSGTTTFHPQGRVSGFAEAAVGYGRFSAALFYDGLRFGRSDLQSVRGAGYFQPDSSSDIFGLRLGWNF